jgi:predicted transcriptional regulator
MEENKKTRSDLVNYINRASEWLAKNLEKSPFKYALEKVLKSSVKLYNDYQEILQEKLNFITYDCATLIERDGKKVFMTDDQGRYCFEPERAKERDRKQREERRRMLQELIEVPYHWVAAENVPQDLTEAEIEAFTGFVIREEAAEVSAARV